MYTKRENGMLKLTKEPVKNSFTRDQLKTMPGYGLVLNEKGRLRTDSPLIVSLKSLTQHNLKIDYSPPNPSDIGPVTNYDSSPLFGDPISIHDVAQGQIADCYYLASLAAIAFVRPDVTKYLIIKQSANKYMARYNGYNGATFAEDHVFINADLGWN